MGPRVVVLAVPADVEIRAATVAGGPKPDPLAGEILAGDVACEAAHSEIKLGQWEGSCQALQRWLYSSRASCAFVGARLDPLERPIERNREIAS
jgi:hypothetical protein